MTFSRDMRPRGQQANPSSGLFLGQHEASLLIPCRVSWGLHAEEAAYGEESGSEGCASSRLL